MSRYKSFGLSLRPERLKQIDDRAKKLGLTRSKYFQALVDADLEAGLLDCTINAINGKPAIKLKDGVSIQVIDKKLEYTQQVEIIVKAFKILGDVAPELQAAAFTGNVRKSAERQLKQRL
jgi:hypothetical protein